MSFSRYPEYRDSGVTWLGKIPAHWKSIPMKYLVRLQSGGTPSKENEAYWDGAIPWASAKDMKEEFLADTEDHITEHAIEQGAAALLDSGSIIFVVRGMILARMFPVAVTRAPMAINQDLKAAIPGPHLNSEYLAWYLRGTAGESLCRLDEAGHGTKALRMDAWTSLEVALPPLAEQASLAAFLDRETAKIDALVEQQERLIELLKEKRQAVISHTVTKGLNPDAPMKDSGVTWLGPIPAHWGVCQSRRMFAVRSEPAFDTDRMLTASQKFGILYQSDFVEMEGRRVVEVIKGVESLKHAEPDDFIISMRSFQGGIEWCRLKGSVSFHYVILTPVKWVLPKFFSYLLKSAAYIQALRTTTDLIRDGQELRYSNFCQVDLPVIPIDEQRQIAEFLDAQLTKFDPLITEAQRAIDLLKERRAALISAAVTGRIDVRALVASNDAPAERVPA